MNFNILVVPTQKMSTSLLGMLHVHLRLKRQIEYCSRGIKETKLNHRGQHVGLANNSFLVRFTDNAYSLEGYIYFCLSIGLLLDHISPLLIKAATLDSGVSKTKKKKKQIYGISVSLKVFPTSHFQYLFLPCHWLAFCWRISTNKRGSIF